MADRVEAFAVTVAANTPKPGTTVAITLVRPGTVVGVSILVPDGHNGLTGLQLQQAFTQVLPFTTGSYLVANNETLNFVLTPQIDSAQWQALVYNLGKYPHTFYVRLSINEIVLPGPSFLPSPTFTFLPLTVPGP